MFKHFSNRVGLSIQIAGLLLAVFTNTAAFSQLVPGCGPLRSQGQYGPYDARTDLDKLQIVLVPHFPPVVEALISGDTNRHPGGDIDYTLRAIPNYHRALIAMMRLGVRDKTDKPRDSRYTVECWFQRAIAFAPNDAIVRMIYSTYLNNKKRIPEATTQLEIATGHAKENGFTHYNIGLHYFDLKNYERALAQAHKAMALGFLQIELRDQLQGAGKWREPVESAAAPDSAASAPAAPSQ
jgi:tetratricopeptide (TPR) repeat protein